MTTLIRKLALRYDVIIKRVYRWPFHQNRAVKTQSFLPYEHFLKVFICIQHNINEFYSGFPKFHSGDVLQTNRAVKENVTNFEFQGISAIDNMIYYYDFGSVVKKISLRIALWECCEQALSLYFI